MYVGLSARRTPQIEATTAFCSYQSLLLQVGLVVNQSNKSRILNYKGYLECFEVHTLHFSDIFTALHERLNRLVKDILSGLTFAIFTYTARAIICHIRWSKLYM